jgi:hypothetical protein
VNIKQNNITEVSVRCERVRVWVCECGRVWVSECQPLTAIRSVAKRNGHKCRRILFLTVTYWHLQLHSLILYTNMHACTYTYTHSHEHSYIHVCMYMCIYNTFCNALINLLTPLNKSTEQPYTSHVYTVQCVWV